MADRHARRDLVEHRRPEEVSVRAIGDARLPAVDQQFGAFRDSLLDVADHAVAVFGADHRSHADAGLRAVADLQRLRGRDHAIARIAVRLADRHQHAAGEAPFAGAAVERFDDDADRPLQIGVRHHDDEVLRAAERLHALARVRRALIDMLGHRRRTDERDGADVRMIANRVDDLASAVHQVDNAGRQIALLQELHHLALRERHLLGRLQHERVARGNRERHEPHRHHRREVERRDRRDDAERLADDVAIDAGGDVLEPRPLHQ